MPPRPDDQSTKPSRPTLPSVDVWAQLLDPGAEELLESLRRGSPDEVALLSRLRRTWSLETVHAAIELTRARTKAKSKFDHPDRLLADVAGVEQATGDPVAAHKARRYARLAPARIVDLCCGIGGDAMSLTRIAPVLGVDADPLRCFMARHNAGCETQVARVESMDMPEACFHLDPARRVESTGASRRLWRFEDYRPGPEFLLQLLATCPDGAVKLGPGVNIDALPRPERHELEFISLEGHLNQAVLWLGALALRPGLRTATRLPDDVSFTAASRDLPLGAIRRWIFTVDPAIERAGLLGSLATELGIEAIHPELGVFTAAERVDSPWLTPFEVCTDMPLRKKKIKAWLEANDAGLIEVKTRGKAVDPDQWQTELRGGGAAPFTVFLLRFSTALRAIICRRPDREADHAEPSAGQL